MEELAFGAARKADACEHRRPCLAYPQSEGRHLVGRVFLDPEIPLAVF